MIRSDHLHEELEELDKIIKNENEPFKKALLKLNYLQIKLLLNIRQNQVKEMLSNGTTLVDFKGKHSDEKK